MPKCKNCLYFHVFCGLCPEYLVCLRDSKLWDEAKSRPVTWLTPLVKAFVPGIQCLFEDQCV